MAEPDAAASAAAAVPDLAAEDGAAQEVEDGAAPAETSGIVGAQLEDDAEAQAEAQALGDAEAQTEAKSAHKAQAEADSLAQQAQADADAEAEAQAKAKAKTKAKVKAAAEVAQAAAAAAAEVTVPATTPETASSMLLARPPPMKLGTVKAAGSRGTGASFATVDRLPVDEAPEPPPTYEASGLTLRKPTKRKYAARIEVEFMCKIYAISGIDIKDNCFAVDLNVMLDWLVAVEGPDGIKAKPQFWYDFVPKVDFVNANDMTGIEFDAPRTEPYTKNGIEYVRFKLTKRMKVAIRQIFDLRDYPFDIQALEVELKANTHKSVNGAHAATYEVELGHPRIRKYHLLTADADMLEEWKMMESGIVGHQTSSRDGANAKLFDRYKVFVLVEREVMSVLWNVVWPIFVIDLLGLMSFAYEECELEARSANALTLLLTLTAFKGSVGDSMPSLPYLTSLDRIIIRSMGFFMVQGLVFALTLHTCDDATDFRFDEDEAQPWAVVADEVGFWVVLALCFSIFFELIYLAWKRHAMRKAIVHAVLTDDVDSAALIWQRDQGTYHNDRGIWVHPEERQYLKVVKKTRMYKYARLPLQACDRVAGSILAGSTVQYLSEVSVKATADAGLPEGASKLVFYELAAGFVAQREPRGGDAQDWTDVAKPTDDPYAHLKQHEANEGFILGSGRVVSVSRRAAAAARRGVSRARRSVAGWFGRGAGRGKASRSTGPATEPLTAGSAAGGRRHSQEPMSLREALAGSG